jgi:hypothetical protein
MSEEYFSRKGAKTQSEPSGTRQRFAALRLCVMEVQGCQQIHQTGGV